VYETDKSAAGIVHTEGHIQDLLLTGTSSRHQLIWFQGDEQWQHPITLTASAIEG
jgi:hypothetical protein